MPGPVPFNWCGTVRSQHRYVLKPNRHGTRTGYRVSTVRIACMARRSGIITEPSSLAGHCGSPVHRAGWVLRHRASQMPCADADSFTRRRATATTPLQIIRRLVHVDAVLLERGLQVRCREGVRFLLRMHAGKVSGERRGERSSETWLVFLPDGAADCRCLQCCSASCAMSDMNFWVASERSFRLSSTDQPTSRISDRPK